MSNIVPFTPSTEISTAMMEAFTMFADINKDIVKFATFPSMSIKGKVFTLNKDGLKTILRRKGADGEDEVAQSIGVVILRANMNSKTFYMKKFNETDSAGARPDCYSMDGVAPSANSTNPQAKKCAICPHNQWGSRSGDGDKVEGKGKACSDNARLAIVTPDHLDEPMLLRVPPASLKPLREMAKELNQRKIPYAVMVTRIGFDPTAASPTLTFKCVAAMPVDKYPDIKAMYDNSVVRAIVGVDDEGLPEPHDADPVLDAASAVIEKAKAAPPKPTIVKASPVSDAIDSVFAEPAAAPAKPAKPAKPVAAPAASTDPQDLVAGMDALLNNFDD